MMKSIDDVRDFLKERTGTDPSGQIRDLRHALAEKPKAESKPAEDSRPKPKPRSEGFSSSS